MRTLTLALTHFERFDFLCEAIAEVQDDPRIDEIVICDDASMDGSWPDLCNCFYSNPKVRLHRNSTRLDSYVNKARAVGLSTNPWVILFDSDNVLPLSYLDAISTLQWEPRTAYLPVKAGEFDYTEFSGEVVDRHNVSEFMEHDAFRTALNTGNYFIHRDEYLRVWDPDVIPHTAEPIYHNFCWLQAGNELMFVPGMEYFHRMHEGSHFLLNDHKTGEFKAEVQTMLEGLR